MKTFRLTLFSWALVITLAAAAAGQEPWETSLDLSLNVAQSSYSNSWTGGEAGIFTWISKADGVFSKKISPLFRVKNTVKLAFGQSTTQDNEDKSWSKPEKSTDKIDLEAVGLFNIDYFVEPFVSLRLESQFLDASVDTNQRYLNPLQITEAAGIARQFAKTEKHDVLSRIGLAIKQNINRDVQVGDVFENQSDLDGGIESVTDAKLVVSDKLEYVGKLTLYKAFYFSDEDEVKGTPQEDDWKAIDINLENGLAAVISKYVQVVFYVQLLYDKQISKKGRLKEVLSLGVTYKLF